MITRNLTLTPKVKFYFHVTIKETKIFSYFPARDVTCGEFLSFD